MTLLLLIVIAGITGWYVRWPPLPVLPLIAAVIYVIVVLVGGVGRDTPVLALAVLADVGIGAGAMGRRYHAA